MYNFRKSWAVLLSVALAAAVLVGCTTAQAAPEAAQSVDQGVARTITVVGSGEVSLSPDMAQVNVGVEVGDASVAEAKAEVDRRMEAIVAALMELGVAEKDIQTAQYNIYFERESFAMPREEGAAETGGVYRVSNMLNVKIRDLDLLGEVLDAAVEAGANQMYGVSFTVADDETWESQAREAAVADARARAEELADLAGVELGAVLSVSEVVGSSPVFAAREMAAGGMGGGIAPGELEFSTQIQVTFAIQ
jgi:hypothetical protein